MGKNTYPRPVIRALARHHLGEVGRGRLHPAILGLSTLKRQWIGQYPQDRGAKRDDGAEGATTGGRRDDRRRARRPAEGASTGGGRGDRRRARRPAEGASASVGAAKAAGVDRAIGAQVRYNSTHSTRLRTPGGDFVVSRTTRSARGGRTPSFRLALTRPALPAMTCCVASMGQPVLVAPEVGSQARPP